MRLKSLEIKGFKSFANETILNFNENVIGIVGPNGSGKSNIVDAVRWVLGEQKSRELRLERMGDVLFNGSKTRKKSPLAQVSLIFDNTKNIIPVEYQSVKISRLLYRNGDSEYRLNDIPCRLKDVTNLFIDTGIGSDSYAIIALGMVDDILSDKDDARRRMFEQASGVSKFKIRKKEALNKLRITSGDLERIQDLLFEIESNLKQLEKQARRAKKYKKLKEGYKNLSIQVALIKVSALEQNHENLKTKIKAQQTEFESISKALRKEETILEKEKSKNISSEQNLSSSQKDLNNLVTMIQGLESKKGIINNKIEFSKNRKEELLIRARDASTRISEIQPLLKVAEVKFKEEEVQLKKRKIEFDKEEEKYLKIKSNFEEIKSLIDKESLIRQSILQRKSEAEKDKAITENQTLTLSKEIENLRKKLADLDTLFIELNSTNDNIIKSLEEKMNEKEQILAQEEAKRVKLERRKEGLQSLKEELMQTGRALDAKENEHALLRSMIESQEGFPESIKYLHQNWEQEGVLLTDIIEPSEECKIALESFLNPYLNHYIVDDYKSAQKALSMLTESQSGKASFFILERIDDESESSIIFDQVENALDHISVDSKYRALVRKLLHNVYVTDMSLAEVVAKDELKDLTILSKKGEFIIQNSLISGGSVGLFEGQKLGRKKNLESLEKQIVELTNKHEKISSTVINEETAIKNLVEGIESKDKATLEEELKQVQFKALQSKLDLQNNERLQKELKAKLEGEKHRLLGFQDRIKLIEEQKEGIAKELKKIEGESGKRTDFNALTEELSIATENFNAANIEYIKAQNALEVLRNEYRYESQKLEELQKSQQSDKENAIKEDENIAGFIKQLGEIDQELKSAYEIKTTREKELNDNEQLYYQARNKINELEEVLRRRTRQQGDVQNLINELKEKNNSIKFSINSIFERMNIEFGLKRIDLDDYDIEEEDPVEELELKKEKIQFKIHNFGDVNPLAIEAYNEIAERHENIESQRNDILEAKASLEETIKEIEITAGKKFMAAFDQIRENFQSIFRTLFTEDDNCDLVLLDDADPLESDIEIIAKPKGKKPKSISLLSGGEKTLTATALLFALYLLKPAPFCIFDEVDAPLDDANIQKFNRIISNFSGDSQFVIVTHNKSTMAEVDVLYGVYMTEPGISGVSPVDFRTYQHEAILEEVKK